MNKSNIQCEFCATEYTKSDLGNFCSECGRPIAHIAEPTEILPDKLPHFFEGLVLTTGAPVGKYLKTTQITKTED